jgi:hypothetical protein
MSALWPFAEPRNVAVVTVRQVFSGAPILLVTHDTEDGIWQFLPGVTFSVSDAMVVALEEVVEQDPSLLSLADLPGGWRAERISPAEHWVRRESPPELEPDA